MNEKMLAVPTDQAALSRGWMRAVPALPDPLRNFSGLPDEAFVRLPVVLMLLGVSRATVWRLCKSGALPAPKKLGSRISVWNVGALRNVLNSGSLWKGSAPA